MLLGLLYLSAAFDCVDHDMLARQLQQSFGICGTALARLQSFLLGRTQQVCYNSQLSTVVELLFGVPQGSILGPLLFLLYTAELFEIISSAGLVGHSYADDTQVYISAPAASAAVSTQRFISCVERTDAWMQSNRLRINADKTQLVWLRTRQQLAKLTITELPLLSAFVNRRPQCSTLALTLTASSPWRTTSPRYAGRACFNYAIYGWSDHRCLWRLQIHSYTRSSAAVSTTVTAFCTGSVTAC